MYEDAEVKRWLIPVLVLLALIATSEAVRADDPPLAGQPRPDQFPGLSQYNPATAELLQYGVFRWYYEAEPSCGVPSSFKESIREGLRLKSAESGMIAIEDPNGWRIKVNCGVLFAGVCGSATGIIGCLGEGFPYNVNIQLNATMAGWSFDISKIAVILHELMHALLTWNEQYGANLTCLATWDDFMNCGPVSRHGFQYIERERLKRTALPQTFNGGALVGNFVWYGGSDDKTKRIAVYYGTYTGFIFWTGQYLPASSCSNPYVCGGAPLSLSLGPCTDVYIGHENALPLSWGRNLQRVGGTAC